jgi:anionic cell wall polymer biosynthesis LytR-Cps2A-Psr (LCP) family protein
MKLLNREELFIINEKLKFDISDQLFIHHFITDEVIKVDIKKINKDTILVSIPEDSLYYGQPDFTIKKINVIGKV